MFDLPVIRCEKVGACIVLTLESPVQTLKLALHPLSARQIEIALHEAHQKNQPSLPVVLLEAQNL